MASQTGNMSYLGGVPFFEAIRLGCHKYFDAKIKSIAFDIRKCYSNQHLALETITENADNRAFEEMSIDAQDLFEERGIDSRKIFKTLDSYRYEWYHEGHP